MVSLLNSGSLVARGWERDEFFLFLQLLEASEFKSSVGILMVDIQVTYCMPFCKPTKPWNITLFIAFHSYIIELYGPWNITCDDNPGHVLLWTVGPRVDHLCIQDLEKELFW
jgi:hypothetical protein